jgi:hypothetical protein
MKTSIGRVPTGGWCLLAISSTFTQKIKLHPCVVTDGIIGTGATRVVSLLDGSEYSVKNETIVKRIKVVKKLKIISDIITS